MIEIEPVENFVFIGLLKHFQQTFDSRCIYTTANDTIKAIDKLFEGKTIEYPYAFLKIGTLARNTAFLNANQLARRGVAVAHDDDHSFYARIMPVTFDVDIEYHTNVYQLNQQGSVLSYAKRWLFAARCGYLKFNVNYGNLELKIGITADENVPIPTLENKNEQEAVYKVATHLVVNGYISEGTLAKRGRIQDILVNGQKLSEITNADGSAAASQYFPFVVPPV